MDLHRGQGGAFRSLRRADPAAPRGAGADPDLRDADPGGEPETVLPLLPVLVLRGGRRGDRRDRRGR